MPASNKQELIAVTIREYARLERLTAQVDVERAMAKRDDDTAIKDVIGHRAHWIDLFLGWCRDGEAGREVHFPAPGYKWSQLKAYNAKIRADQADLDWAGAHKMLAERHAQLLALIQSLSEEALYAAPMKGGKNHWTTGRWAEASGASHYRSATKFIRQCLRDDGG